MTNPLLVFDLDGTLIDTAPDLIATLSKTLDANGFQTVDDDHARTYIGYGARQMIERAILAQDDAVDQGHLDRMFEAFIDHYTDNICVESRPFPGLIDRLDHFESEGWAFAICTNKREHLSKMLLDALDISHRFQAICGSDTFGVMKPDPEHLLKTIEASGGAPGKTIMVGDAAPDIGAAQAAGIPVVGVTFGYTPVPVADLEPTAIISHYDQLTSTLLNDLLERRSVPFPAVRAAE